MRRFLNDSSLSTHFKRALLLGAALRVLSAWFVYGPQALDDYKHGVWPAYQFFAGLPLDIPEYRSHLLVWFLSAFVEVGSFFGVTSALGQVRAMYLGLATVSLLGIVGTYFYVRESRSKLFGALALYLTAAFPLMPFVSTRAFGEAIALSFVLLGVGLLERGRKRDQAAITFAGFIWLGLATLFRFHVGLIFLTCGFIVFAQKRWRAVLAGTIAGVVTLIAQAGIDILSGKAPLATLIFYITENQGGGAKYGVMPWYNPWLFVLGLTLAPFSFVLFGSLRSLWNRHWHVLLPFLVFVGAHSLAAHKEERFLYPIIGLELWMIAHLWVTNTLNPWARKFYSPVFLVITAIVLPVGCLVNTQEGEIEPPAYAQSRYGEVIYLDYQSLFGKSRFQFYFLRPPAERREVQSHELNANAVDESLAANSAFNAAVLLTSLPEARAQLNAMAGINTMESACGEVREAGSLIDKLLYALNPKHNQRRRPTWYLICERKSHA